MITYSQRGVRVAEVWFNADMAPTSGVDIVSILRSSDPIGGRKNSVSQTLVSDLSLPTDSLLSSMGKENRYKINRAATKDDAGCEILKSPSPDDYREFVDFYAMFAAQKGMPPLNAMAITVGRRYLENGNLVLTYASKSGKSLVWHSYFAQGNRCRLLHSASLFRDSNDSAYRSMVGRVNRWLHWQDMLLLKEHGVRSYDWGGWHPGGDPGLLKINQFKESFGGMPVNVYDARYGVTIRGRLENAALRIARQLRNRSAA